MPLQGVKFGLCGDRVYISGLGGFLGRGSDSAWRWRSASSLSFLSFFMCIENLFMLGVYSGRSHLIGWSDVRAHGAVVVKSIILLVSFSDTLLVVSILEMIVTAFAVLKGLRHSVTQTIRTFRALRALRDLGISLRGTWLGRPGKFAFNLVSSTESIHIVDHETVIRTSIIVRIINHIIVPCAELLNL